MPQDSPKTVSRSSVAFLSGTFLSRITGLGRDMSLAFVFGSSPAIAALMVAFRFTNLIRRLFGEGPFTSTFIPHFEEARSQSQQEGVRFFRDLFFSLSFFLILLILAAEAFLWGLWKWGNFSPDNAQILYLTILMLPGVLFICLYGISSGFVQCERKFFLSGFAPTAFNAVWIAAALFLNGWDPMAAVIPLSIAIVAAFFMQWAILAPQIFSLMRQQLSARECFRPRLFAPEMRRLVKPFLLGIIGVGAVQINSAIDAIFARCASLEGPAYLWYAIRIQQLPLALFGIALSAALLPPLARALKEEGYGHYLSLLRFALRRSFSLILPCALGLFVLGCAGINLLYGRGDFSQEATYQTAMCLWGYGIGLLPMVFVVILAPAFFAHKDYRTPTIASVASVLLSLGLNAWFVFGLHWGAFSIAVSTSAAAWFNCLYLARQLSRKVEQPLLDKDAQRSFYKTGAAALIAAAGTLLVSHFFLSDPTLDIASGAPFVGFVRDFSSQLMHFSALAGTFGLLFFSYARLFKANDVLELVGVKPR